MRRREKADREIGGQRRAVGVAERDHLQLRRRAAEVGSGGEFVQREGVLAGDISESPVDGPKFLAFTETGRRANKDWSRDTAA